MAIKEYFLWHLAILFPRIADAYEYISGREIPYRNNHLMGAMFFERKNHLVEARSSIGLDEKVK